MSYKERRKNTRQERLSAKKNRFETKTSFVSKRVRNKKNWHLTKRKVKIIGNIFVHRIKPSPEMDFVFKYTYVSYRDRVYIAIKLLEERIKDQFELSKTDFNIQEYNISAFGGWRMVENRKPSKTLDSSVVFEKINEEDKGG